jgi:hypothetical protein
MFSGTPPAGATQSVPARLSAALSRVIALRENFDAHPELAAPWKEVKHWQSQRLRRTYPDLFAQPRYKVAGEFFLSEIYGAKDFGQRDREALRVVPKLARMLPERAVETLLLAVELDEMSEQLDARVASHVMLPVTDASYAAAYVAAGTPEERRAQIDHVERIGRALEKLARLPLLSGMLHLMRAPAEAAGLSHLHFFLQRGFDAFKAMGPAGEFLDTISARETRLMERLFARDPAPFRDLAPA